MKSNSWIGIILLTVYKLKKKHPDREFKFRFLISLLEDSKEDFIAKLYAALILLKHHERTDILELNSRRGRDYFKITKREDYVAKMTIL